MLAAGAYSFRQKSRLAIALSWIGGYVNVVALMATAHVVSHTTGNATTFAERLTQARWPEALMLVLIIACFTAGAMLAAVMTHQSRHSQTSASFVRPIAAEVLLLCLFALGVAYLNITVDAPPYLSLIIACVAAAAMGLQNATITRISSSVVRTTHLTGVFTDLGIELVQLLLWIKSHLRTFKTHRFRRLLRLAVSHTSFLRATLYLSIVGSFLFGVVVGTWNYLHMPIVAMVFPIVFLGWLIFMDRRQPIAQLREMENASDNGTTVYELINPQAGRPHRAPNFQRWASSQTSHKPVVVLVLNPLVHLDTNAALDLHLAAQIIKTSRRKLVIANLTRDQHLRLQQNKLDLLLGKNSLHEDLDGAMAQAQRLVDKTAQS